MNTKNAGDISTLTQEIKKFVKQRDWMQFHNHKDMVLSLVLETTEVLEHFQWKNEIESADYVQKHKEEIADELADVAIYLFELTDNLDIDLSKAIRVKMLKNATKYPVSKAKGKTTKYSKL